MEEVDRKIAKDFFSLYQIEVVDSTSYLLTSKREKILVRTHIIHPDDAETLEEVSNLMDLHLSFDQQHIAPLLHFEKCPQGIRAFYLMDQVTLRDQAKSRRKNQNFFTEEEIWVLFSSVTDSLLYLQSKGTIYGVLSSSKVFVSEQIRLMDPSAFNLAPVNLSRISFHSPQIAQIESNIDFHLSDVYLLGLCMLQAASLVPIDNKMNKQAMGMILKQIEGRYSAQLMHVLEYLLQQNAEQRPSFRDIQEYIETEIQIKRAKVWPAELLNPDIEDSPSQPESQLVPQQSQGHQQSQNQKKVTRRKQSDFQSAKGRFLESPMSKNSKDFSKTLHHTIDTIKNYDKERKKTEQSRVTYQIHEFKLKNEDTVNKNRKKPRAVQIKNRNAVDVKKIGSVHYDDNPNLMSLTKQQTERAKQYLKASNYR